MGVRGQDFSIIIKDIVFCLLFWLAHSKKVHSLVNLIKLIEFLSQCTVHYMYNSTTVYTLIS